MFANIFNIICTKKYVEKDSLEWSYDINHQHDDCWCEDSNSAKALHTYTYNKFQPFIAQYIIALIATT